LLDKQSFKKEKSSKDDSFDLSDILIGESPTGFIFHYHRFEACKISYEIPKSDSLTSPEGYIFVDCEQSDSKKCGDFDFIMGRDRYFTTIELARKQRDHESYYKPCMEGGKKVRFLYAFVFTFQKNKWEFKDVLWKVGSWVSDPIFWTAFGKPSSGRVYVKDNDFWKELLRSP
jgi:hypothetical protein